MALAEVLGITHSIRDEVKVVDGKVESVEAGVESVEAKVESVEAKVESVEAKVEDMGDKIGDKVQCVDDKVQTVINGARGVSPLSPIPSNIFTFRRRTSKTDYSAGGKQHRRSKVFVTPQPRLCSLLTRKHAHREPVKTAPTIVALSRRSIHKSQHCTKASTRGNRGLVLSRQYLHRVEVYWLPLVGLRKTCVHVTIIRASRNLTVRCR